MLTIERYTTMQLNNVMSPPTWHRNSYISRTYRLKSCEISLWHEGGQFSKVSLILIEGHSSKHAPKLAFKFTI